MELYERHHKCRRYRKGKVRGLFDDDEDTCAGCHYYNWHKNECKFPFKELTVPSKPHHKKRESKPLVVDTTNINDKKEFIINNRIFLIGVFIGSFILTYFWALFVYWRE